MSTTITITITSDKPKPEYTFDERIARLENTIKSLEAVPLVDEEYLKAHRAKQAELELIKSVRGNPMFDDDFVDFYEAMVANEELWYDDSKPEKKYVSMFEDTIKVLKEDLEAVKKAKKEAEDEAGRKQILAWEAEDKARERLMKAWEEKMRARQELLEKCEDAVRDRRAKLVRRCNGTYEYRFRDGRTVRFG